MAYVLKKRAWESCGVSPEGGPQLEVNVIFTDLPGTRATLRAAAPLARDLGARVTILVAQVVPYPLDLDRPPVAVEFTEAELCAIASEQEVETSVQVYLCRNRGETIQRTLKPESLVVIGSSDKKLAQTLRRDGHRVVEKVGP